MKISIFFIFHLFCIQNLSGQTINSNNISFDFVSNDVTKSYSLNIRYHNTEVNAVEIFKDLKEDKKDSKFGNLYYELESESNGTFHEELPVIYNNLQFYDYPDPQIYPLEMKQLVANSSEIQNVSLKFFRQYFSTLVTRCRFRIFIRIGHTIDSNNKVHIQYKESPWFYFLPL